MVPVAFVPEQEHGYHAAAIPVDTHPAQCRFPGQKQPYAGRGGGLRRTRAALANAAYGAGGVHRYPHCLRVPVLPALCGRWLDHRFRQGVRTAVEIWPLT